MAGSIKFALTADVIIVASLIALVAAAGRQREPCPTCNAMQDIYKSTTELVMKVETRVCESSEQRQCRVLAKIMKESVRRRITRLSLEAECLDDEQVTCKRADACEMLDALLEKRENPFKDMFEKQSMQMLAEQFNDVFDTVFEKEISYHKNSLSC